MIVREAMLSGNPEKEGRVKLSHVDQEALRCAKALLENPSLAAKITGLMSMPIEKALKLLPDKWAEVVNGRIGDQAPAQRPAADDIGPPRSRRTAG
jgi:hypothetical protein